MRIIVCIKQIEHIYARTGMSGDDHFLSPEDRIHRLNPFDEAALELAQRVREQLGRGEVTVVTLGALTAEDELRRCLALGADRLYRIESDVPADPWSKSILLARAAGELGGTLILCGKESLDRRNGQVGAFMAHRLGMPFLAAVSRLRLTTEGREVEGERKVGRGVTQTVRCQLPAVVSVDLGVELRLPRASAQTRSRSAVIETLFFEAPPTVEPRVAVRAVFPPRYRPRPLPGPDAGQEAFVRIEQLLRGSRTEKKGVMLRDDCESQVEEVLAFLTRHGFLGPDRSSKEPSKSKEPFLTMKNTKATK